MARELRVVITGDAAGLQKAFGSAATSAKSFGQRIEGVGTSIAAVGRKMTTHMTLPILAIGAASTKMASDFQASMDLIQTQAGGSAREVEKMSKAVLELAPKVGTGPEELSKGLYHLESQGLRSGKALDALKIAAEGAKVGGADLEDVTNALGATLVSGIKGVSNLSGAMGMLNATVGAGDMRMQDLADALGTGLPAKAKIAGVGLRDVSAALAVFGDNNIRGAEAGTLLGSTIRLLSAPSKAAAKELKGVGINALDLADVLRKRGLVPALELLQDKFKKSGLTASQTAQILTRAFGGRQSGGIQILLGQMDRLKTKEEEVAKGAKTFGDSWTKTTETTKFKTDQMKASFEAAAISIGTLLLPVANKLAGWAAGAAQWLGGLSKNTQEWIMKIAGIAAAIGPAILIAGKFIAVIGAVTRAIMFLAMNPLVILAAAVAGFVAAMVAAAYAPDQLAEGLKKIGVSGSTAQDVISTLRDGFQQMVQVGSTLLGFIKDVAAGFVILYNKIGLAGIAVLAFIAYIPKFVAAAEAMIAATEAAELSLSAMAGPIGLLVAGLGLVAVGLLGAFGSGRQFAASTEDVTAKVWNEKAALDAAKTSLENLTNAHRDHQHAVLDVANAKAQLAHSEYVWGQYVKKGTDQTREGQAAYRQMRGDALALADAKDRLAQSSEAEHKAETARQAALTAAQSQMDNVRGKYLALLDAIQQTGGRTAEGTKAWQTNTQVLQDNIRKAEALAAATKKTQPELSAAASRAADYGRKLLETSQEMGQYSNKSESAAQITQRMKDQLKGIPTTAGGVKTSFEQMGIALQNKFLDALGKVSAQVGPKMGSIVQSIGKYQVQFQAKGDNLGTAFSKAVTKAFSDAGVKVPPSLQKVVDQIAKKEGATKSAGDKMGKGGGDAIAKGVEKAAGKTTAAAGKHVTAFTSKLSGLAGLGYSAGVNAGEAVAQGLDATAQDVAAAAARVAAAATVSVKKTWQAKSPPKVFVQLGKDAGLALAGGMQLVATTIMVAGGRIASDLFTAIQRNLVAGGAKAKAATKQAMVEAMKVQPALLEAAKYLGYQHALAIAKGVVAGSPSISAQMNKALKDAMAPQKALAAVQPDIDAAGKVIGRARAEAIARGFIAAEPSTEQQMRTALRQEVQKMITDAAQAVTAAKSAFTSAFGSLASDALAAFDAKVAGWQSPAAALIAKINMGDLLAQITSALGPGIGDMFAAMEQMAASGMTDFAAKLGDQLVAQLTGQLDAVNAALAGAQSNLASAQAELAAAQAAGGDNKDAVDAAQKKVDAANAEIAAQEAKKQAIITALGEIDKIEKAANDAKNARDRLQFGTELTNLQNKFANHKISYAQFHKQLMDLLQKWVPDYVKKGAAQADAIAAGLRSKIKEVEKAARELANAILAQLNLTAEITVKVTNTAPPGAVAGKALGGPVRPGIPYMVGERGPELFVPSFGGRIIPTNQLNGQRAGGTNVIPLPVGGDTPQVIQLVLDRRILTEVVRDELGRTQFRNHAGAF